MTRWAMGPSLVSPPKKKKSVLPGERASTYSAALEIVCEIAVSRQVRASCVVGVSLFTGEKTGVHKQIRTNTQADKHSETYPG